MAEVTVISQPSNFDASYGELKYKLQVPATGSGDITSSTIGTGKFPRSFMVTPSISLDSIGASMVVLNTSSLDGVWVISKVDDYGDSSRVFVDGRDGVTFVSGETGNYEFGSLNERVIAQLWVNGSFFIEKTRYLNNDNLFVFDFAKEMQVWQGNELEPLGFTEAYLVSNSEAFDTMSIKTAIVTDEIVGGVLIEVPQLDETVTPNALYDSGTDIIAINSTVPQVEWVMGSTRGEIKSTGDLSGFVMGDSDSTKRFLTPAPLNQTIGFDEALELSFIAENDPTHRWAVQIKAYDVSDVEIASTNIVKDGNLGNRLLSGVWRVNVGPRSQGLAVIPSNTSYYTVAVTDTTLVADQSETRTFTIDSDCSRTTTRFCWLNERGGYDSFTFKSPRKLKSRVKKDTHKKDRDYSSGIASREVVTTNVFAQDNMSTGTNKVVRETAEWLQGLLESSEVWIELEEGNALHNVRIPVTLNSKSKSISDTYNGMFNINLRYSFGWSKDVIRAK
jgi:hypothetical protein